MLNHKNILLIGYSGHAYVAIETLLSKNQKVSGYFDNQEKVNNPFQLNYLGKENEAKNINILNAQPYFIAIGSNHIRERVFYTLQKKGIPSPINAIHQTVYLSSTVELGRGILISKNASINAFAKLGNGLIANTGCIIEHDCQLDDFVHIAPGAVLAGNVKVGKRSFIGANAVVKQGITIGQDVVIGAGTVIIRDVPNNVTVVGNPGKIIKQHS